jgi:hypothetical protein
MKLLHNTFLAVGFVHIAQHASLSLSFRGVSPSWQGGHGRAVHIVARQQREPRVYALLKKGSSLHYTLLSLQ